MLCVLQTSPVFHFKWMLPDNICCCAFGYSYKEPIKFWYQNVSLLENKTKKYEIIIFQILSLDLQLIRICKVETEVPILEIKIVFWK